MYADRIEKVLNFSSVAVGRQFTQPSYPLNAYLKTGDHECKVVDFNADDDELIIALDLLEGCVTGAVQDKVIVVDANMLVGVIYL